MSDLWALPNFLTLRNFAEQVKRLARMASDPPAAIDAQLETDTAIRLSFMPIRPENAKRYRTPRAVSQIPYIVGHVTDVSGGFGVQKWGPDGWQTWMNKLNRGEVPREILDDIHRELGDLTPGELARTVALCSRYAQLPYHYITSRKLGVCENRPLEHRTKASSRLNDGIAVALDCGHKEDILESFAKAGQLMIFRAYYALRQGGKTGTIQYVVHGQGDRNRWNDTHRRMHLAVAKPAVMRMRNVWKEDIEIGYEVAVGGGRPITTRDDPDAHFDERGRRVRTPEGKPL